MKKLFTFSVAVLFVFAFASAAVAQETPSGGGGGFDMSMLDGFGIRAGLGTDINLGIAYGGGINKIFLDDRLEIGVYLYGSHAEESSDENGNTYDETTNVVVFGALANYLGNYEQDRASLFYLGGWGLGIFHVKWTEESDTDSSLGTLLPNGGSKQEVTGTRGGMLLNVGAGYNFEQNIDIRFEIPMFIIFSAPGDASAFVPTFTLTAGYRF